MFVLLAALAFAGCGDDGGEGLAGRVVIDGSSTVYPLSEAVSSGFLKKFPGVDVTVAISGTGGGFKRFTIGEIDIADASRPIKPLEREQAQANGVEFIELPVAYDGLTIAVNNENRFVDQLTVEQLQQIFLADQAAKTWQDVNQDWPPEEIRIYAPGTDSGTFDYFKEVVAGDEGNFRSDMSTNEDDNFLVTGVAGDPNAIGFFGASYYYENEDKLRAVPIVNPQTGEAVLPTPAAIESGEYAPFSRPLFIYVSVASLRRPEVRKFIAFYLDNAAAMSQKVGYVPLSEDLYEAARMHVDQRWTGTHFLTEQGEKRSGPLTQVYTDENLR
ncbi:MAG: PstS family phosphate ABC transporter substrate-binding protein [Planctomycetaceae bacterium]